MTYLDPDERSSDHPRNRMIALVVVLAVIGGGAVLSYGEQIFGWGKGSASGQLERELRIGAQMVNQSAPQRVDELTTLTGARVHGSEFTYLYSLNQEIPAERLPTAQADIQREFGPRLCGDPGLRRLLNQGAIISAEYRDPRGHRVRVTVATCSTAL